MNVWHTHHICGNLSFVNIPLFVTSFEVLPDRGWILAHFPTFAIFVKIANCQYDCFVVSLSQSLPNSPVRFAKYVIFVKPAFIDMPLLSSCFNVCQTLNKFFSKFVIFVKSPFVKKPLFVISFEYLAKPLMNFWHTRHFCRNLPFSPKFTIFLL